MALQLYNLLEKSIAENTVQVIDQVLTKDSTIIAKYNI